VDSDSENRIDFGPMNLEPDSEGEKDPEKK
jgi:hypothetical protein